MPDNDTRLTAPEIRARKGGEKIVCLTAYTAPVAALLDPHVGCPFGGGHGWHGAPWHGHDRRGHA